MSIKIEEVSQPQEFVYPLAFRSKHYGYVVLFSDERSGVVVSGANGIRGIGEFWDTWDSHTNSRTWEPVNLTISHP